METNKKDIVKIINGKIVECQNLHILLCCIIFTYQPNNIKLLPNGFNQLEY